MAWIGAILIGLSLGLFGSGGSIVTVPVLVYLVGQDEKVAIAGSLFIVGAVALLGSVSFIRKGLIDWQILGLFTLLGGLASFAGGALSRRLPERLFKRFFAIGLLLVAIWILLNVTELI